MKRFQKYFSIPAIIIIAMSIFSGFSNPTAEKEAQTLVKDRTSILQKAFYQQVTMDDAEMMLTQIETYPLLTEDIRSLREWDSTQLDLVRSMKIVSFEQEKNYLNFLTYKAVIYWDMVGLSENYTMRGTYYIVLKKDNGQYKLSVFEPTEEKIPS